MKRAAIHGLTEGRAPSNARARILHLMQHEVSSLVARVIKVGFLTQSAICAVGGSAEYGNDRGRS